ncbi:MAG: cell division protein ZapE [Magnetococcales bacterium]|nr:cell division protein ZapE [Magnetococcales bacterium]
MLKLPSQQYQEKIQDGTLRPDADQEAALPILDSFVADLHRTVERKIWRRVETWQGVDDAAIPKGLYMYGPVGRGKSMLMQMVFDAVNFEEKRRVHFHPFIEELQQRMHKIKPTPGIDVMLQVASEISQEARLLCFDEFFIDNIQDAMILGRLVKYLFKCGVTLCATSNNGPEGLFKGGFNRTIFLPLLKDLQNNINELDLGDGSDWRREDGLDVIQHKQKTPHEMFYHLTNNQPQLNRITLGKKSITANGNSNNILWFDFKTLCTQNFGAPEYFDLCKNAKAVLVSDIPIIDETKTDAALRLITLIDLLYEYKIPLRTFSNIEIDKICTQGPAAQPFKRAVSRIFALFKLEITTEKL